MGQCLTNKHTRARLVELEWGQHWLSEKRRQFSLATMIRDFSFSG